MKEQNNKYIVKDILRFKIQDGKEYFLVWWQGFKRDEATWEPMKNMIFLKDYKDYYKNLRQHYLLEKKTSKSIKLPSHPVLKINRQKLHHQDLQIKNEVKISNVIQRKAKMIKKNNLKSSLHSSKHKKTILQVELRKKQIHEPIQLKVNNSKRQQLNRRSINDNLNVKENSQNQQQDELQQPIQQKSEGKRKIPITVNPRMYDANNHVNLLSQNNSLNGSMTQKINLNNHSPIANLKLAVDNKKLLKVNLRPMQFQVRVKESKSIPLWDQQIKNIKGAFYKDEQMMFEVQFENNKCNLPIIVHQEYLNLLWPKKYYEYLCTKVTE